MWLSDTSVKRPVFATVLCALLVAFGVLAFQQLPLREYPDVSPPVVSVSANYPGASAEVVEKRITQLLESEISGIEGIKAINSRSRDERATVSVEFELDRDIEEATNDVRDRVSRVTGRLPEDVDPPQVSRQDADARPVMYVTVNSTEFDQMQLTDYVERYVIDRFTSISGVSQVTIAGGGRPSMRIWIDRRALAARNLAVTDVEAALLSENVELPAGRVDSSDVEFTVRMARNYASVEDFRALVVATGEDGHVIRLGEVARVELGPRDQRRTFRINGADALGMGIVKQSTANTVEVLTEVGEVIKRVAQDLPAHMSIAKSTDDSVFIRAAINAVFWTIGITVALVGGVILLFLGSVRSTLIPVITIPICLVGACIALAAFGLSVNLITLLALVLSIGLVVDDAIVVLENIHRRIDMGEPPLLAAFRGSRQVAFAVLATTAVLVAVFTPIIFLKDNIGLIFAELAVTISAAVIFSSVLALSLVPMLCSKWLRPEAGQSALANGMDRLFGRLSKAYESVLQRAIAVPWAFVVFFVLAGVATTTLFQAVEKEYAPTEDQGLFFVSLRAPEGTSLEKMRGYIPQLEDPLKPLVASGDIQRALVVIPTFGATAANRALIGVGMHEFEPDKMPTAEAMEKLLGQWRGIVDLRAFAFMRSGLSRGGGDQPVQFVIGGSDYEELARWRDIMLDRIAQNPGLTRVSADLEETQPQLRVRVDKNRAAALGVSVRDVGRTLQAMMTEQTVTTYVQDGEEYDVVIQAVDSQRASPSDLTNLYVRSTVSGELIALNNLVRVEAIGGASSLNRYNRFRAVTLSANLAEGYTLGEALDFLANTVATELPALAQVDYKGESLEFREASGAIYFSLGMALLVVFLVLAAQFESFSQPLVVMVTVPLAIAGGLLGLLVSGLTLNIFSQIGIILLVGIAAKNGILIVEFINQLRDAGKSFEAAIVEASAIRLRPVLMTTVSTTMGSVPLILASGPGSEGRIVLGVVVFSGVAIATLFTLFMVPVFYRLLARGSQSPDTLAKKIDNLREEMPNVTVDRGAG
ncbi:MAG: efflux RND transporter permease subunit [Pseudomonadota bacterium]